MAQSTEATPAGRQEVPGTLPRKDRSPAWSRLLPALLIGGFAVLTRLLSLLAVGRGAHTGPLGALRFVATTWDPYWYGYVLQHGYSVATRDGRGAIGYYPGYPALGRLVYEPLLAVAHFAPRISQADIAWVSLLIASNACLVVALVALWHLFLPRLGTRGTLIGVGLFLAAPGSFVLSAGFSESAFIAASVLAFLSAERRRWLWCGVLTAAAALIRIEGVLLILPLAVLWFMADRRLSLKLVLGLAVALLAAGAYPLFLWARFGDPLLYVKTKEEVVGNSRPDFGFIVRDILSRIRDGVLLELKSASAGLPIPPPADRHPRLFGTMLLLDQGTLVAGLLSLVPTWIGLGIPYALWIVLIDLATLTSRLDYGLTRLSLAAWPVYFGFGWLFRRVPGVVPAAIIGLSLVAMLVIAFDFTQGYYVV